MVRGRNPAAISGGNVAWSGTGHADGHGRNRHHLGDAGAGGGGQEEQDRVAVEDVLFSGLLVSRDDDENMTAAAAQGGEGVRIRGGGDGSDRRSLQAHALPVSRANGGPPSPSTPSSWLLGPDADLRDPRAAVDGAPHAQHEQQAEQLIWLRLLDVRRALMLFGYRGAEGWRARAAEDGWERENRQARRAPAQEGQQEQDDDAFTAACEEAREDGKLTREGGGGDAAGEEQVEEERQCRICFGGEFDDDSRRDRGEEEDDGEEEEEEDLGRLISPCLCSGSMRHVHVKCLNRWRLATHPTSPFSAFPATSGSRSFRCPQCHFSYRIARTSISGLASSRLLIALVSFALFFGATIVVGECLALTFRSRWIRRLVLGPSGDGRTTGEALIGATVDPLVSPIGFRLPFLANGVAYVPAPGSGITELVVRSIRAFASGEAEEVVFGFGDLARAAWSKVMGSRRVPSLNVAHGLTSWMPFAPLFQALASRLLRDLSLGFSLIGSASAVAFLLSSSLLLPFHVANNVRVGAGVGIQIGGAGAGQPAARRPGPVGRGRSFGMGSAILVVLVVMGAIRVIKQLYGFTRDLAQYLLVRAEIAILEVNPRGEVLDAREDRRRR